MFGYRTVGRIRHPNVRIWSREPYVLSATFSKVAGMYPLTRNPTPFDIYGNQRADASDVPSRQIREIIAAIRAENCQRLQLNASSLHAWCDLREGFIEGIIHDAFPLDAVEFIEVEPRKYRIKVIPVAPGRVMILFPRGKFANFCDLNRVSGSITWAGPEGLDEYPYVKETLKPFMENIFSWDKEYRIRIRVAKTLVWTLGPIDAATVASILKETYPERWFDVQIKPQPG